MLDRIKLSVWLIMIIALSLMISIAAIEARAVGDEINLLAWGRNNYGQLGDGTTSDKKVPTQIGIKTDWIAVSAGNEHALALDKDGRLWAWGRNFLGQLGDGTSVDKNVPTRIGDKADWAKVSAGNWYSLALDTSGRLWAWGYNHYGQLGDETSLSRSVPTWIRISLAEISAGYEHSMGLNTSGNLYAWGRNHYGQLGDGTTVNRYVPTFIGSKSDWLTISAGYTHTVGLDKNGRLWAWGNNVYGKLGDGTTTDKIFPKQIGTKTDWMAVSAGQHHTIALDKSGRLWGWGSNLYGQLGDGTYTMRYYPTQIGFKTDWIAVSAGHDHTVGLDKDGRLWAWGRNNYGQLGDGTTTDKRVPTQIGSKPDWEKVSSGRNYTVALSSYVDIRIAGSNRYTTAVEVSQAGWPGGAGTVLLARGDNFPDSLAGVSLAYQLNAPILLTPTASLNSATKQEIVRLGAGRVIILGGTGAISAGVETELLAMDTVDTVDRLGGGNRYDTAKLIAEELDKGASFDTAFLASGLGFPDALAAASYGAMNGYPILLTGRDSLPAATGAALDNLTSINNIVIVGGEAVISSAVETELMGRGLQVQRIMGANRYETAVELAREYLPAAVEEVFIATGLNFPDALAGGVLAAKRYSGVLLVPGHLSTLPGSVEAFITGRVITRATILGGTGAVSEGIEERLLELLE